MSKPFRSMVVLALTAAGLAATGAPVAAQQPLYNPVTGSSLYTSLKAYDVGDVITIVIRESAIASSNAKTETKGKTEVGGGPGAGALGFIDLWGLDVENKYSGEGKMQRTQTFLRRLRAELAAAASAMTRSNHWLPRIIKTTG